MTSGYEGVGLAYEWAGLMESKGFDWRAFQRIKVHESVLRRGL